MCEACEWVKPGTDNNGREWARVDQVKEGSVLIADGGFIGDPEYCTEKSQGDYGEDFYCILENSELVVQKDHLKPDGINLWVPCAAGQHYLDGQYEQEYGIEFYKGVYLKE